MIIPAIILLAAVLNLFGQVSCENTAPPPININANAYCFDSLSRANNLDIFENPLDCHSYFQCFYLNETNAVGILMRCQTGTYFDQYHLTCLAEGAVPCQPSPCSNPTIANIGCYQLPGQSCRQYFVCEYNETRCCPIGTRFDPNTCSCSPDETCIDFCMPLPQTTFAPLSNGTACTDSFGNTLLPVAGRPDLFQLGDYTIPCASGSLFSLNDCSCSTSISVTVSRPTGGRQCQLWLPFDTDITDKSTNEFSTFLYGNALPDFTTSASGQGSLFVNDGRLEIPGMKNIDLNNPHGASWCFSFRCSTTSPYICNSNGGILSNNRDETSTYFSIIAAVTGSDSLTVRLHTENGTFLTETADLTVQIDEAGWNTACVIYADDETVNLYLNGVLRATSPLSGPIAISHSPYVVGNDLQYGSFIGNIDNVLVCNTPLTIAEVKAYSEGDTALLVADDLIPVP